MNKFLFLDVHVLNDKTFNPEILNNQYQNFDIVLLTDQGSADIKKIYNKNIDLFVAYYIPRSVDAMIKFLDNHCLIEIYDIASNKIISLSWDHLPRYNEGLEYKKLHPYVDFKVLSNDLPLPDFCNNAKINL